MPLGYDRPKIFTLFYQLKHYVFVMCFLIVRGGSGNDSGHKRVYAACITAVDDGVCKLIYDARVFDNSTFGVFSGRGLAPSATPPFVFFTGFF